jgi:hypothetical protein
MKSTSTIKDPSSSNNSSSFFSKDRPGSGFFDRNNQSGSFFSRGTPAPPVQAKLTVGEPDDKYEKEADATADKVVQRMHDDGRSGRPPVTDAPTMIQHKCAACEKKEALQKKEGEPEDKVQAKPIFESNVGPREEEHGIQRKCAHCEQEEKLQRKSSSGPASGTASIEQSLQGTKGGGAPLPNGTKEQMESSFGADFSGVRIHHDSSSVQMNRSLNAHAFTHGNDIYFNSGKYEPGTRSGQHLLAHELTHTLQQGAVSRQGGAVAKKTDKPIQRSWYGDAWDAVSDTASSVGSTVASGASAAWDTAKEVGSDIASGAKAVAGAAKDAAVAVYDLGADALRAIVDRLAPGLISFLGNPVGFIKDKIVAGVDALTGGLFSQVQSKGLAAVLMELFGSAFTAIGTTVTEKCAEIPAVAKKLWAFVKKLTGPAIQGFKKIFSKIGDFFSKLWDDIGKPAWEGIKKYAGAAWDWIVEKATWLWNVTKPIRETVGKAWDWIKKQFGIAWAEGGSVLDWIKEKAAKAWGWVKEKIQPIIGPLKVIGGILVMISPAGPIIAIYYGAPYIWEKIKWLAEQFNKQVIVRAKEFFYKEILPAVQSALAKMQTAINGAMSWLQGVFTQLGNAVRSAINALSNFALFRMIGNGIRRVGAEIQAAINWVGNKALAFGKWVASVATRVWNFLEPIREILRNLLLIGMLGPMAILDDGVWKMMQSIVAFSLKVPCIRELEGLLQVPYWMDKLGNARQTMKDLWFMINNPDVLEAKAKAFLEPYIKEVPGRSNSVLTTALGKLGLATSKHIAGILRYLMPSVNHLLANWWPEAKKMIWSLIWPFGKESPLWTDGPKLWKLVPGIWNHLWHGEFHKALDSSLEWLQAFNNVLGIFSGWIVAGGALVGAIVGAFAGGVGAAPGAGVGFEIGIAITEGLMASMLATETTVLGVAVYDLFTAKDEGEEQPAPAAANPPAGAGGPPAGAPAGEGTEPQGPRQYTAEEVHTGHDRIQYAYQRIANSSITLAILGAMFVLGSIGGEIAEGLITAVKAAAKLVGEVVPELAELASGVGKAIGESKLGKAVGEAWEGFKEGRKVGKELAEKAKKWLKGEAPSKEHPVIDEAGDAIVDAEPSADGERLVETTEDGGCKVCYNPCEDIYKRYKEFIDFNEEFKTEFKEIKNSGESERVKTQKYKELEQKLADAKEQMKADLLTDSGRKFKDPTMEENYQAYRAKKIGKGETPRNRLGWKQASDWWRSESPTVRGNSFDAKAKVEKWYPYDQVHLEQGYILDAYDPVKGEIVSRKAVDLENIEPSSFDAYLDEIKAKYRQGRKINSAKYRNVTEPAAIDQTLLKGKYILEIPKSNEGFEGINDYIERARRRGVEIRFRPE